jgi:hypothetical protein
MPLALPFGVFAIAAIVFAIWRRDERLRGQREMLRRAYELGEEVLGASSADQILDKVRLVVPRIFGVSSRATLLIQPSRENARSGGSERRRSDFHSAFGASGRTASRCGSLLPLPDFAGDSGHLPQPVSSDGTARRAPWVRRGRCCSSPC